MKNNSVLENSPCPLCQNQQPHRLSDQGQFGLPCHVVICPNDGMVFLSPRWSKERYLEFYQNEYDSYYRESVLSIEEEELKYRDIKLIAYRLDDTLGLLAERTSVLDVGAGMGWSLSWLFSKYPNVKNIYAIEPSRHCITNLEEVVGAKVVTGDVDSCWGKDKFDLVIMRHVLEHFMDPLKVLEQAASRLEDTGVIYIAVPDMMRPAGSLKNHWLRAVHTYYFSENTLSAIASKAGLRALTIGWEGAELWGVFEKCPEGKKDVFYKNIYQSQVRVFRVHQFKRFFLDPIFTVGKVLLRHSPCMTQRIAEKLKKVFGV